MDSMFQRRVLEGQFIDLRQILHKRNMGTWVATDEELSTMSLSDLAEMLNAMKTLARTPE